jgi:hypothetical protein
MILLFATHLQMRDNAVSNYGYPGGALSLIAVAVSHVTFTFLITHHNFY